MAAWLCTCLATTASVARVVYRAPHVRMLCSVSDNNNSPWPLITSSANSKLKQIKKLHVQRQRKKLGLVLLEGHRLVLDALGAGCVPDAVVLHDGALDAHPEGERLRDALSELAPGRVMRAPPEVVDELSDTLTPQGVLAVVPQPAFPLPASPQMVLVCDAVSDPGNMGTLLRSAAGAGVDAALLTAGCCDAWGLKALRAGMGAQLRLPLRAVDDWEDAANQLDAWGSHVLAADAAGPVAHYEVEWCKPSALVVGSEAHGLSAAVRADARVQLCRIPLGEDGLESLNAAVAGSVILFEAQRQRLTSK